MLVVRGTCDLDVASGELVALDGEDAAALLRALAAGEAAGATVDGFDVVREREAARRRIGFVGPAGCDARFDIAARAMSHGLSREVAERRALYLLESLEVRQSGWRLALALALVHEPRVLLVEEPPAEAWPLLERLCEESLLAIVVANGAPPISSLVRRASVSASRPQLPAEGPRPLRP